MRDRILSYFEMCQREGSSLQRGMNFEQPHSIGRQEFRETVTVAFLTAISMACFPRVFQPCSFLSSSPPDAESGGVEELNPGSMLAGRGTTVRRCHPTRINIEDLGN